MQKKLLYLACVSTAGDIQRPTIGMSLASEAVCLEINESVHI